MKNSEVRPRIQRANIERLDELYPQADNVNDQLETLLSFYAHSKVRIDHLDNDLIEIRARAQQMEITAKNHADDLSAAEHSHDDEIKLLNECLKSSTRRALRAESDASSLSSKLRLYMLSDAQYKLRCKLLSVGVVALGAALIAVVYFPGLMG